VAPVREIVGKRQQGGFLKTRSSGERWGDVSLLGFFWGEEGRSKKKKKKT